MSRRRCLPHPIALAILTLSASSWAQTTPATPAPAEGKTLTPVTVKEKAEEARGKDSVRATTTTIGKGKQELRDIPQSITVITEKLMDDRNLDTVKDALRQTAGVTFQAAEGGEEDVRVRGFSLATTGDIYLDGMRDPAFYDRDTFNMDRVELIRGSASMLFGRGSTGGAANQVSKMPRAIDESEVNTTVGNYNYRRITGDFNIRTGEDAGLRLNAMATTADNNGSGSRINKKGLAAAYRFGIGTADEFTTALYFLDNRNGINYGIPWIKPKAANGSDTNTIIPGLAPGAYYGLASDRNYGSATTGYLSHTHRFSEDTELKTQARKGHFTRDLHASAIRFAGVGAGVSLNTVAPDLGNFGSGTVFTRGTNNKIQDVDTVQLQSDFGSKFEALGYKHNVLAGIDFSREAKKVAAERNAAQGGITLTKPTITAADSAGGGWVNEDARVLRPGNAYVSNAIGIYGQDMLQITPTWKALIGLRRDAMRGSYDTFGIPAAAPGPVTTTHYEQAIAGWSKRYGVLYQPDAQHSYHFMYGTSFNTSGDAYSYNALSANTPPEQSKNLELGAKFQTEDKQFSYGVSLFRTTKYNERNTDPDTAATRLLLSGQRHATGLEVDFSGRITPKWEVFGSYAWIPDAKVDVAASTATTVGNRVGDRPGLTPRNSGSLWNTYQITPQWRVGAGINFRSSQAPADVTAPPWEAPGFTTADILVEYTISQMFTAKVNVSNISNKLYADSLYRGHYVPGAGRLVQFSLSTKF